MSFLGLFGGDSSSSSSSTSHTLTKTQDNRTAAEGGSVAIGPGTNMGAPGAVTTRVGDFSSMTQTVTGNKFKTGMTGAEVAAIVRETNGAFATAASSNAATQAKMAELATTALSAQSNVPADWGKYIVPVGVIIAIVAIARRRRSN
jgi:hypothetical protein